MSPVVCACSAGWAGSLQAYARGARCLEGAENGRSVATYVLRRCMPTLDFCFDCCLYSELGKPGLACSPNAMTVGAFLRPLAVHTFREVCGA